MGASSFAAWPHIARVGNRSVGRTVSRDGPLSPSDRSLPYRGKEGEPLPPQRLRAGEMRAERLGARRLSPPKGFDSSRPSPQDDAGTLGCAVHTPIASL